MNKNPVDFIHLHNHSEYSLLDGTTRFSDHDGKPSELLKGLAHAGTRAMALTDHGNLYGAFEFYTQCNAVGIKPIVGCEMYLAKGSRLDRGGSQKENCHLTVLARSFEGYQNLMALSTKGFLEGYYYDPRIDKKLLAEHAKGLIVLSGCLKSELCQALGGGDMQAAMRLAGEYRDILEDDAFYLEIMDHGLEKQRQVLKGLLEIHERLKIPLVATNDCHYGGKGDVLAHDARVCISTGRLLSDTNRLRFESHEFYFKSPQEMAKLFHFAPESVTNTLRIADSCHLVIPTDKMHLPDFPVPPGQTQDSYLEALCREGLQRLGVDREEAYASRLAYELSVIRKMGFSGYFLIVWDFIRYAKQNGVPVGPGRGSGAGAVVSYALDITTVDPIRHKLLFERFLNPDRRSMPDLDIDFSDLGRDKVIEYVRGKYGADRVAQIVTFGSLRAKLAVRDVGRVMGVPLAEVDRIAKLIPGGPDGTIAKALADVPELAEAAKEPRVKQLLDLARKLEGLKRHTGVHAAGIVITQEEVYRYAPLAKGSSGVVTTQYDGDVLPKLGLLKMDFLGLRNLSVIQNAVELVRARHDPAFDIQRLPTDDERTYKMLASGKALGVFQLDSEGMRDLLRRLKPTAFDDISAVLALYRPGPMKAGMLDLFVERKHGKKVRYDHPKLEPILKDTYGCIVYQEQVMEIAKSLASFTPGEADGLRKAMGKKIPEEMEKQRGRFVEGCKKNSIDAKLADKIYSQIDKFGGYGFNKCVVGSTRIFDAGTGRPWTAAELCRLGRKVRVCALGPDGKVVIRRVRHAWSNGTKPVFRVRTALGKEIRVTDNHPFHTFAGWKELKELKPGDRIAVPRVLPIPGEARWDKRRAALLGWVLSEGNTCHPSGFYLYTKSRLQAADMLSSLRAFPDTAATVRRRRGQYEIFIRSANAGDGRFRRGGAPWNKERDLAAQQAYAKRHEVSGARAWLDSLSVSGLKATKKHVPAEAFSLDAAGLAVLAGRLWAGDGFICTRDNHVPFYATSSPRLASDVQELLLRLGILSRVAHKTFKYRGGLRPGYAVQLIVRESVERFLKLVGPHVVGKAGQIRRLKSRLRRLNEDRMSKDTVPVEVRALVRAAKTRAGVTWAQVEAGAGVSVEELHRKGGAKKGFRRWTLAGLAEYFGSEELRRLAVSDIYWDTVKEIMPEGREETFDLEVPGAHNFVAEGIFVHNSHTVAYGTLAYQTGYLKANYPIEYVCALLTSEIGHSAVDVEDKENKLVTYISDAAAMGIQVLAPDVRRSEAAFSIEGSSIRFGLTAVKNVGSSAAQAICAARVQEPFSSLDDFCRRVDLRAVNRKTIESLIKAGGMDSLLPALPAGAARARLMSVLEETMNRQAQVKEDLARGQGLLFGAESQGNGGGTPGEGGGAAAAAPWPEHELLQNEKEVLGFYLSGHPLVRVKDLLACCAPRPIGDLDAQSPATVRLAGLLSSVKRVVTKKGEPMARAVLEDLSGEITLLVFPKAYAAGLNKNLKADSVVVVAGRLSWRGDLKGEEGQARPELIAEEIIPLEAAVGRYARALTLRFSTAGADENFLADLRRILRKYPGRTPVHLRLETPAHGEAVLETGETVALGDGLFGELGAMLGDRAWQIESGAS